MKAAPVTAERRFGRGIWSGDSHEWLPGIRRAVCVVHLRRAHAGPQRGVAGRDEASRHRDEVWRECDTDVSAPRDRFGLLLDLGRMTVARHAVRPNALVDRPVQKGLVDVVARA